MAQRSKRHTDGRNLARRAVLVRKLICITPGQNRWLLAQARAKRLAQGEVIRRIFDKEMGVEATA